MIVVQDSDTRREVEKITKNGRERVSEMEDTEVLTDMDVTTEGEGITETPTTTAM